MIEVGGARFDSWRDDAYIKSVGLTLSTDSASEATWKVHDPGYRLLDRWVSGDGLSPLEVKVWVGLGPDLGAPVFEGLLAGADWREDTTSFFFYDRGYLMRRKKETEYHRGLDAVQIAAKLAKQNGLSFEGPDEPVKLDKHKSVIQDGQTDWEFASERLREVGLVLFVRGNTLYAKEAAKTGEPVAAYTFGEDEGLLDDASFRYKAPENQEGRPGSVTVHARGRGGRRLTGRSDVNQRGTAKTDVRSDLSIKSQRHADRRARAHKLLQREHSFTGTISLLTGFKGVRPATRQTVEVLGVGKLLSGKYLVDEIHHEFGPGVLETSLVLYRDVKER